MRNTLPIFNWSLRKLLDTEPDSLRRARIGLIFTLLILSLIKAAVALPSALYGDNQLQLVRILLVMGIFLILLKILLIDRRFTIPIGVIMIWVGLFLTWTSIFLVTQTINIATIQLVVIIILGSFYIMNWRWALLYSFLGALPVCILIVMGGEINLTKAAPHFLTSPSYEIVVALNFITIIITHFLYHQALHRNVAEKEALNRKLQEAVKEANLAVQAKADFLSTMSHELRTPLNSVIGMTQLLLSSPYSEEQSENLKIVNFSAMNLHMLINDILDFNKMESDKLSLEAIPVDLYALINDICSGMRFQAEEKGLALTVDVEEPIRLQHVITDPTRLTQVVHNLIGNAIKFTHSGSVYLSLKVLRKDDESINIAFSIKDTGIGISIEQQALIFEAFIQASSSTTRNFGGTGLGLAIVKRLLGLFGSDVQVRSAEGEGSDFYFDISFRLAGPGDLLRRGEDTSGYDISELRILIVEDNPVNSLLLKKILSNWNNLPVFTLNGYEAIEELKRNQYDVILMDIHMPLLDGYETARAIRSMSNPAMAAVPIIALTASVSSDLFTKIKTAGMNDYINKPFNSDDLYRKLKTIAGSLKNNAI